MSKPNLMDGKSHTIVCTVVDPWEHEPSKAGQVKYVRLSDRPVNMPYSGTRPYGYTGPFVIGPHPVREA